MSGRHGEKTGMSGRHGEKTERNVKTTGEDVERADPLEVLDCAEIPRNKKKRKKKHYGRNFIIFLLIIGSAVKRHVYAALFGNEIICFLFIGKRNGI